MRLFPFKLLEMMGPGWHHIFSAGATILGKVLFERHSAKFTPLYNTPMVMEISCI